MSKYEIYNEFPLRAHEEGTEYLQGSLHGPVGKEITATELDVIGEIPKDLDGVYIRNGHTPVFQTPHGRYHWFAGDSMVHATTFKNGKAEYRNRMVLTAARRDRTSFGCGEADKYPYFDDCFLQSSPRAHDFPGLATAVQTCVASREQKEGMKPPSEPQVFIGPQLRPMLPLYAFPPPDPPKGD